MKKIDLIKEITLILGGSKSSWYAKLSGHRKVDLKTALKLKEEFNISLEIWSFENPYQKINKKLINIPKRGRKRKEKKCYKD